MTTFIAGLTLAAAILSFLVPAFYPLPDPTMSNKRLGVFFYQYNPDSPTFYYSALRFPEFYKENSDRASRPLTALITKPASLFTKFLIRHSAPHSKLLTVQWGEYSVGENCAVYFGWIFLNVLFLGCFLFFCAELFSAYFHVDDVKILLVLLTFTAPVILTLTWLHTTVIGWLITALTLCLARRLPSGQPYLAYAALLGLLLLGKPYAAVLFVCALCLFDFTHVKQWIFAFAVIAFPTALWRIFCLWHGIDASGIELFLVRRLPLDLIGGAFPRMARDFLIQNFIGLCILANPLTLFFVFRGLMQPLWRYKSFSIVCTIFLFDLFAHFIQHRTGAIYMYNYFYAGIPLIIIGIKKGKTINPETPVLSHSVSWLLIAIQAIWLIGTLFFQLGLWRRGQWF